MYIRLNHAYLGNVSLYSWPMFYLIMDEGNVGHTGLIIPWITYIFYIVLNMGQIDIFNTVSQ